MAERRRETATEGTPAASEGQPSRRRSVTQAAPPAEVTLQQVYDLLQTMAPQIKALYNIYFQDE